MGRCIVCGRAKEDDYCPNCRMKTRTIGEAPTEIPLKSKADYWIKLMEEAAFAPGLSRVERMRRSLNLLYESGQYLELGEFTKWARRWRQLTAPFAALEE